MSDLLNQASLVMVPSGYKEDTVYSVVPTDGSGDLSFTRASNGTRINSAGLVEVCPWNFVEQSSNLGSWSTAGVTITTGITDAYGTTNAVTMSNISSGSNTDYIAEFSNPMDLPGGTVINTSVYLKGSGTIGVAIERGNTGDYFFTSQIFTLTNAWVRYDFAYTMPSGTRNGIHFYVTNLTGTTATSVDICFPQINYGSTAKPYFPTTDRLNVPRLTYQNGGGGCPSLLLEKQSTNVAYYSNDLATAPNVVDASTTTANVYVSPDGTQNAMRFTETTAVDRHGFYQYTTVTAQTYTASIFTKQTGRRYISFVSDMKGVSDAAYFDLQTKTAINVASGYTCSVEDFGNGWLRLIVTFTATAGTRYVIWGGSPDGSSTFYGGSTSISQTFYGYQLEAGSYATSYIPTTSATATRVADACFKTGISSLIGQTEGVIFFDGYFGNETDEMYAIIQNSLGSSTTSSMYLIKSSSSIKFQSYDSTTTLQWEISGGSYTLGQRIKIAGAYKANDIVLYVNGVQIGTDTSATIATCTALQIGVYPASPTANFQYNGKVNQAILFPTRLSNSELQSLTTL
jgi:hypothetical protein